MGKPHEQSRSKDPHHTNRILVFYLSIVLIRALSVFIFTLNHTRQQEISTVDRTRGIWRTTSNLARKEWSTYPWLCNCHRASWILSKIQVVNNAYTNCGMSSSRMRHISYPLCFITIVLSEMRSIFYHQNEGLIHQESTGGLGTLGCSPTHWIATLFSRTDNINFVSPSCNAMSEVVIIALDLVGKIYTFGQPRIIGNPSLSRWYVSPAVPCGVRRPRRAVW